MCGVVCVFFGSVECPQMLEIAQRKGQRAHTWGRSSVLLPALPFPV